MTALATRAVVVRGHGGDGITKLATALPADCGFALIAMVSEHPDLIEHLRSQVKLGVAAAEHERAIEPNWIYVVPADRDVVIHRGRFAITPSTIPGVQLDRLARSLADEAGRNSTLVILEAVGSDGVIGVKRIREAGGMVFAGPIPDGPVGDLPRSATSAGLIDQVAELEVIASQLCRVIPETPAVDDDRPTDGADGLRDILALLRVRSGHDFSAYKRATLYRRVARRMQVCQTESINDYHAYLRDHPTEVAHLLRDFLISVTNFFRDPDSYHALATQIIPRLFENGAPHVRAWVAGCATGEEAYSLAMLLLEHAEKRGHLPKLQIFATDIDEDALTEARAGRYPETISFDVSPARRERFFVREGPHYRVTQELRETVLFSSHNLLRDPPFSRLDLVSCRNLLIYLNRDAQNRVLSMFHFGLRPEGCLLLGSSESADNTSMFSPIDPKYRLYSRRMLASAPAVETMIAGRWQPPPPTAPQAITRDRSGSLGELHYRLAERHAPPSILVDGDLEVVHVSENAGRYLEVSPGEPSRHVLRMMHSALRLELRAAIYAARQTSTRADTRRVAFDDHGKRRVVEMRIRAADTRELGPHAVVIFFDDIDGDGETLARNPGDSAIEPVVREIEDELHRTRDQLRNTIEQYETSVEELKASNEELQAINEELRSATEELETSKEELQSVNEELTTLNHELGGKIDELSHANSDLQNLMTSTDIGVLFLDRGLNVKRYTPRVLDLINLIPSDLGRPFAHLTHKLDTDELPELARLVVQHLRTIERHVSSRDGRRILVRLLPYRSLEERIDGVVVTFVDVSDLRDAVDARDRSEAALVASDARLLASLRGAPLVVFTCDDKLQVTWGYALGDELAPGPLTVVAAIERPNLQKLVDDVLTTGTGTHAELALEILGERRIYDVRVALASPNRVTVVGFESRRASTPAPR